MTEHPVDDSTGGEPDEPLVDDLVDESRRPDEDHDTDPSSGLLDPDGPGALRDPPD